MKIAKFLGIALTLPVFLGSNIRPAIASEYQLDPMVEQQIIDRLCQMVVQGYTGEAIRKEVGYLVGLNLPNPFANQGNTKFGDPDFHKSMHDLYRSTYQLMQVIAIQNLYKKAECNF